MSENKTPLSLFRRRPDPLAELRKDAKQVERLRKEHERAARQLEEADVLRAKVRSDLARIKENSTFVEEARTERSEIRQGVKSSVDTVPMPVRLEVDQVKHLKILAALRNTTASAIIRKCIADHLDEQLSNDPGFAAAVESRNLQS